LAEPSKVARAQRQSTKASQALRGARASAGAVPRGGVLPRPRHVPQRTCVACHQGQAKRELVRIVRTPVGTVRVDPSGKLSGRGAYVHQDPACWTVALKRSTLANALKIEIIPEGDLTALRSFAEALGPASI
jgi:predicted RNA-binding protein YlxR (DUF448 family)